MGSQMGSDTNTHEGYMWRLFRKCNQKAYMLDKEHCENSNLKFIEILSTPLCSAGDQDWRSTLHALKCASCPPDGSAVALLS